MSKSDKTKIAYSEKLINEFNCIHKRYILYDVKIHPQKLALFYSFYDKDGKYPTYDKELSDCQILIPKINHACIQKEFCYKMVNSFLGYF